VWIAPLGHDEPVPDLICPLCGTEIDPAGPGVASHQPDRDPNRGWASSWVPFIEDLRGTPTRLVHPTCFTQEQGVDALVAVVHAHDDKIRHELHRHWRKDQGLD
jgi:hypothetical protein